MSLKPHNTSNRYWYGLMPENQDDRKGLKMLVDRLFVNPQVPSSSTRSSKNIEPTFSKYSRNKHKTLQRPYDPKGWLKKDKTKTERNFIVTEPKKRKQEQGENKKPKVREDFCKKYGIKLPVLEEVLARNKKLEKDMQHVNNLIDKIEPIPAHVDLNVPEYSNEEIGLDCKHLSDLEIDNACKENYQYIFEIHTRTRYSKRYELFRTNSTQYNFSYKDLRYNTSMITFSYKQKEQLLAFLSNKFCDNIQSTSKADDYFFKVLLPELCLKIFMDVHDMNQNEAVKYLEKRPIK